FACFFDDAATSKTYTLSLHDALPISVGVEEEGRGTRDVATPDHRDRDRHAVPRSRVRAGGVVERRVVAAEDGLALAQRGNARARDRKSTRLNSSHVAISYAVFCLKKK